MRRMESMNVFPALKGGERAKPETKEDTMRVERLRSILAALQRVRPQVRGALVAQDIDQAIEATQRLLTETTPIEWSTITPVRPGWYWLKNYTVGDGHKAERFETPHVVQVREEHSGKLMAVGEDCYLPNLSTLLGAEWAGPILTPDTTETP